MNFSSLASQMVELGQLVEIRSSLVNPLHADNGRRPHVGPEHISSGSGCIDWKGVRTCADDGVTSGKYEFQPGDIIYSKIRPYLNKVAIADRIGLCSADMYAIKALPGCDARYLYRYLQTPEFLAYAASFSGRANIPKLNRQQLLGSQVPLPPLDEQRRIAAILDKANALRRKRKRALELLDGLTQSIFLEMFGKESAAVQLGEVCNKITDGTHQAPKWTKFGVPFLFVSNVRNQTITFKTDSFISEEDYQRLTKHSPIEAGDILYTAVGSYGHAAVVPPNERFIFQRHVAHLKPDRKKILPEFLSAALESASVKSQADRVARGVAQKTVTLGEMRKLIVPLPSLTRQKEFVAVLLQLRGQVASHLRGAFIEEGLFSSLQHRAFSGQL